MARISKTLLYSSPVRLGFRVCVCFPIPFTLNETCGPWVVASGSTIVLVGLSRLGRNLMCDFQAGRPEICSLRLLGRGGQTSIILRLATTARLCLHTSVLEQHTLRLQILPFLCYCHPFLYFFITFASSDLHYCLRDSGFWCHGEERMVGVLYFGCIHLQYVASRMYKY